MERKDEDFIVMISIPPKKTPERREYWVYMDDVNVKRRRLKISKSVEFLFNGFPFSQLLNINNCIKESPFV